MHRRLKRSLGFAVTVGLGLLLLPDLARAEVIVKVSDTVNFRWGFQLQSWADWTQDPISTGYQQSMFIRRVRAILAGNLTKDVSFFFQTDNPRVGNTINSATGAKNLNSGFLVQDAFGEWKVTGNDFFILDIGK